MTETHDELDDCEIDFDDEDNEAWTVTSQVEIEWLELLDDEWADDGTSDVYLGGIGHEIDDTDY